MDPTFRATLAGLTAIVALLAVYFGLPRQYLPKGIDVSAYSQAKPNAMARRLNERPRKTLNFRTPAEMFSQSVASTG